MAISKVTPRKLSTDSDERLQPADTMSDAINVSITENGSGTLNVIKPHTGNQPILALTPFDKINDDQRVAAIGQVSDPQRGFIYYAVCSDLPNPISSASAIYQYSVESDTYKLVIRDSRLNFRPDLFVKMDVVNGDFTFNGVDELSTLLYFTDNVNPPRKINVDRALLGQYAGDGWDYNVNVIKAAPVYQPTCYFSTDSTIKHNNFKKDVYQFATQVIYRDGEESAISPYSKLLIPQHLTLANNEEEEFVINELTNNLAIIDLNLLDALAASNDVSQVRLLAKNGNQGTFFIVDQFDPNVNKLSSVFGQNDVEVYNSGSRQYRFYNETLGAFISQQTVNKLYDNVPFVSQGQCVAGNRLMFSNYTEGRPNNPVRARITPVYGSEDRNILIGPDYEIPSNNLINGIPPSFTLQISEILQQNSLSLNDLLEGGERFILEFPWSLAINQIFPIDVSGSFSAIVDSPAFIQPDFGPSTKVISYIQTESGISNLVPVPLENNLQWSFINQSISTIDAFLDFISTQITQKKVKIKYGQLSNGVLDENLSILVSINEFTVQPTAFVSYTLDEFPVVNVPEQEVDMSFEAVIEFSFASSHNGSGDIFIQPYISSIDMSSIGIEGTLASATYLILANDEVTPFVVPTTVTINSLQEEVTSIQVQDSDIFPFPGSGTAYSYNESDYQIQEWPTRVRITLSKLFSIKGFKTGSLHKLGVVYYDEYNRSGFVNDIGTAYADWYNSQSRLLSDVNIPSLGFASYNGDNTFSGPVSFEINFPVNQQNSPPSWARTYQIVYPGAASVLDFVQYTVGGAYLKRKGELEFGAGNTREIDTDSKRIYVSIDTLDKYRSEKSTFRDYSYTVGDKLRIVSWKSDGGDIAEDATLLEIYPSASDGAVIELDVVGVELLDRTATNPIAFAKDPNYNDIGITSSTDISDNYIGKFLVLECPRVVAGSVDDNGNQVKFGGFDWFDLANDINYGFQNNQFQGPQQYPYPDGTLPGDTGVHWYKDCLVEIYTPRPSLHDEFWYEIGEAHPVVRATTIDGQGNEVSLAYFSHGDPFIVSSGDVHYRPVPCKANSRTDQGGGIFSWSLDKEDWSFSSRNVEANTVSDIVGEPMWDRGRAHIKFEGAATYRRFAQVTYSDEWSGESRYLSLSSFNATLGNFYDFDKRYGVARYIAEYGNAGSLLALQENKMSITPVNISIIQDASGSQNLALSTNVLNNTQYYVGDYGCGSQPSAVLIQDNDVYFVDDSRRRVLRFSNGQLVPISNKGVSSLIETAFDRWSSSQSTVVGGRKTRKIISGFDPRNNTYYVTFYEPNIRTFSGFVMAGEDIYPSGRITDSSTFSYNKDQGESGNWISKHSFVPQIYSNQNDTMFSCSYVRNASDGLFNDEDMLFFKHGVAPTCTYYLQSFDFIVEVIVNTSPSQVKTFNTVSFEGDEFQVLQLQGDGDGEDAADQEPSVQMQCVVQSNLGQQSARIDNFVYREGSYYSMIPMDTSNNSVSYIAPLGVGSSSDGSGLVFKNKLSGVSIPGDMRVQALVGGFLVNLGAAEEPLRVVSVDSLNQITLNDEITQPVEDVMIYMLGRPEVDGDPIRGHYAKIRLTKKTAITQFDLYTISTDITASNYGHGNLQG